MRWRATARSSRARMRSRPRGRPWIPCSSTIIARHPTSAAAGDPAKRMRSSRPKGTGTIPVLTMALAIEDYGLIGDCHAAALVGRDGSIDWLCLPRFDSGACFAALLGGPEHGRWLIAPVGKVRASKRNYREGTLVMETVVETEGGAVRMIDFMPLSNARWDVVRIVEGLRGRVAMRMELVIRFDYGSVVPWVRKVGRRLMATAGPHELTLDADVEAHGENLKTVAEFEVGARERVAFALNYHPSFERAPVRLDTRNALAATEEAWRAWARKCQYRR